MRASVIVRLPAYQIWQIWEDSYRQRGQPLVQGSSGKVHKMGYRISEVKPGNRFSMIWKAYLVRLELSQSLRSTDTGTEIIYEMQMRGLFAVPIRWLLHKTVRKQLQIALDLFAEQIHS